MSSIPLRLVCTICGEKNIKEFILGKTMTFKYYELSWAEEVTESQKEALMKRFYANTEEALFEKLHMNIETNMSILGVFYIFDLYHEYKFISKYSVSTSVLNVDGTYTVEDNIVKMYDETFYIDLEEAWCEVNLLAYEGIKAKVVYSTK